MKNQLKSVLLTTAAITLAAVSFAQVGIGTTSPNSTLDVRGSLSTSYRAVTAATTLSATDNILLFSGTTAATITLPTAVGCQGRIYIIKNASTTLPVPVVTIATTSSQTIDAASSWTLDEPYETIQVISNGTNWQIEGLDVPVAKTATTGGSWNQGGNRVTAAKSVGTITNFDLPFITNNTERMRLTTAGYLGIGNTNAGNYVDVSGTNTGTGVSGLRLRDLGTATLAAANSKVLSVNASGDVIVTNNPAASQWMYTGNAGTNPPTNFLGTTDDKQMVFKSNNQSYLEFGRRQTLGLYQGYADYDNNDEKVTYIRSALQFEADAASFYKPKMFTDVNGNFRVKGSSAGTDYFEFGSTGTSNNGGFEFIIGDDGDEPILFKSWHYINGMSEIMRLQSGRMAVGSNAFNATNPEKLLIDAGVTNSINLMTGKGSIDNYLQINVQNRSNGGSASSDVVATADNGTETSNYIDMGVNSSGYNYNGIPILNGVNNTYLYGAGNDLKIGNIGNNKAVVLFTTPDATQANAAERMRITGAGNVGINNAAPNSTLSVTGSMSVSYRSGTGSYTVLATDYVVINTGGAATWTLPAASGCAGRIYKLINHGTGTLTISAVTVANGSTVTTLLSTSGSNTMEIISDGTAWRKMD